MGVTKIGKIECCYSERIRGEMKQLKEQKICRKVKEEEREATSRIGVINKWKKKEQQVEKCITTSGKVIVCDSL